METSYWEVKLDETNPCRVRVFCRRVTTVRLRERDASCWRSRSVWCWRKFTMIVPHLGFLLFSSSHWEVMKNLPKSDMFVGSLTGHPCSDAL